MSTPEFVERPEGCPSDATHIDDTGDLWRVAANGEMHFQWSAERRKLFNTSADWNRMPADAFRSLHAAGIRPLRPVMDGSVTQDRAADETRYGSPDGLMESGVWRPMSEAPTRAALIELNFEAESRTTWCLWNGHARTLDYSVRSRCADCDWATGWVFGSHLVGWRYADAEPAGLAPLIREQQARDEVKYGFNVGMCESDRAACAAFVAPAAITPAPAFMVKPALSSDGLGVVASADRRVIWGA